MSDRPAADRMSGRGHPIAILTGGGDRPYALGLASSLIVAGVAFDFIGSDFLQSDSLTHSPKVRFLNLRGNVSPDVSIPRKLFRVMLYYLRLIRYAISSDARIFHILWNNKLENLDRTLLLLYYRLCGRRIVYTVHNVNVKKRDGNDRGINRLTLRIQYHLSDHLFVHTEMMKRELESDFAVPSKRISVIPFGINSTVPDTTLSSDEARRRLGIDVSKRVLLFFGNIAPYKGLAILVEAMASVVQSIPEARLVIAGRPKGAESYWIAIEDRIEALGLHDKIIRRIEYVPDEETEVYFKAADLLVLPYLHIFQSGVLFLGYNFGLPVVASDVGSLKEDIVEGETGFICGPGDSSALAEAIVRYFSSDLYRNLESRRTAIRKFARERYSWAKVAAITKSVYDAVSAAG